MRKQTTLFIVFFLLCSQITLTHSQITLSTAQEIIITDADTIWNNTTQSSSDLNNVTSNVTARFLVEYVNSLLHLNFFLSPVLNILAQNVSARIIAEYANSLYQNMLISSSSLEKLTSEVVPRIIAEYANFLYSHNLVGSSNLDTLAEQVTARIITEYANSLKIFDLYEPDFTQPENRMPTANAGGPYYGNVNEQIQFDGGGTDPDGDEITAYAWDFDNDGTIDSTLEDPTWMWPSAGTYHPALKVKDDELWSEWDWSKVYIFSDDPNLGTYPSSIFDKYYIKIFNIDDQADVYVNNQIATSVGFGEENTIDITDMLQLGINNIELSVTNFQEGWTYGFEIIHDDKYLGEQTILWQDNCGTFGIYGCSNNQQTGYQIVYEENIVLNLVERSFQPLSFIHLTDVHIGMDLFASLNFAEIIKDINKLKPNFIIITGDIVDSNYPWYFKDFLNFLKCLDPPIEIYIVAGNHDSRITITGLLGDDNLENFNQYIPAGNNYNNQGFLKNNYQFYGLYSGKDYNKYSGLKIVDWTPESTGLSDDQMALLHGLEENFPKIIFMHHPAINDKNDEATWPSKPVPPNGPGGNDACISQNRENFINYCTNNNVQLVLTGHTHKDVIFNNMGGAIDIFSNERPLFIQTPAAKDGWYRRLSINSPVSPSVPEKSNDYSKIIGETIGPVNLHAYDSQNNHTGLNISGEIETNIPDSLYLQGYLSNYTDYENNTFNVTMPDRIIIFYPSNTYKFEIISNYTASSQNSPIFNFTLKLQNNTSVKKIIYYNISLTENTNASVSVNLTSSIYTMYIDYDGDGIIDQEKNPDKIETNYKPQAQIISPVDNSVFNIGDMITFNVTGSDLEDVNLSSSSMIWVSNINGIINIGKNFSTSNLSANSHKITLYVTDSEGLTCNTSVYLHINAPDLTIQANSIVFSDENPTENTDLVINATIYNAGDLNANNINVVFYDGLPESEIANYTINNLADGENITINTIWNISGKMGPHLIHVKVDPGNIIKEYNETNNTAFRYLFVSKKTGLQVYNENPCNNTVDVDRPPAELNVTVEDPNGDIMDVYIRWKVISECCIQNSNCCYSYDGDWITVKTFAGVGNGTYEFIPLDDLTIWLNDWIWGDTTYTWSVNVSDGTTWTNETYQYTTGGSRYDVNNDDNVNFQDAGLVWVHRTSEEPYDGIYDVNQDGQVNFQDAGLTWINRD